MIYSQDEQIKLGGLLLPGLIKKLEVKSAAQIEEVEVEGSSTKPKQAVGYEDCKITIELIVDDTPEDTAMSKLEDMKALFRRSSQKKPTPLALVCREAAAADVSKVLFKDFSYSKTNKVDQYAVTIELWEYIPVTITATKSSTGTAVGAAPALTATYQTYLASSRG